jgi:hypothetical protein
MSRTTYPTAVLAALTALLVIQIAPRLLLEVLR